MYLEGTSKSVMTLNKILVTVLIMAAVQAFAGAMRASEISVFVGAEIPASIKIDDMKTVLDNGPIYGFRLGNDFVRYFGMEHTLAFSTNYLFPSGTPEVKEAKGFLYNSNLRLNFPGIVEKMVPFLTAGVGIIHQYGDHGLPVGTKFAFNYGGGAKFPNLAGPLGARVDFRGYNAGVLSKKLNIAELSFGLMISLGR